MIEITQMLPKLTPNATLTPLYHAFLDALRGKSFFGEIKTNYAARLAVATDNSVYQVVPQAVVMPRSTADVAALFQLANQEIFHDVQFAPRGGGTGTNGQSLTAGIIIDCSKFMNQILEVNLEQQWVRVQPGVVLDQLNLFLQPQGFHFAPQISPSNRATIGGMINTDACGNGSKRLGRTSDHVIELTYVTHQGNTLNSNQLHEHTAEIAALLATHRNAIHEKFTSAPRTLNGYNLLKADGDNLNLNYLLCGSEGTLAVITECKLKLTPIAKYKKLLVIKYRDFFAALRAQEITDDIHPMVIETIDEKLITLARTDNTYWQIKDFIEPANAINLVEFSGNDEAELEQQIQHLINNIESSSDAIGYYVAKDATEIKLLWELRKKSVGLISKSQDGTRRPIPFIEDTAVPPEKLADYIAEFKALLDKHHLIYGMYGHVDAGCVHVRPALDLKLIHDEKLFRELSDKVANLVDKFGGVMWGEHGKGYRSEYGKHFFGETLYDVVRQIKTFFDPYNQLNPGKIAIPLTCDSELVGLTDNLRSYRDRQIPDGLQQEFDKPISCNGNGACFNFATNDAMCPSYKVTRDRIHSPKGRSTLIREWTRLIGLKNNDATRGTDFSREVYDAMNGCLGCKACTNQCPLSVDIPEFKAKFLARYHERYRRPWRDYLIAHTESVAKLQAKLPRLSNALSAFFVTKIILKYIFKLVQPPKAAIAPSLAHYYNPETATIILLQDAFTSFYESKTLTSTADFFHALGYTVHIEPFFINGKPLHNKGFKKQFSRIARDNIHHLRQLASKNIPIIGIDPSITLTYRDEYQKFLGSEKMGFNVLLPQEFLHQQLAKLPKLNANKTYYLLSHCTEKTTVTESEKQWQAIFNAMGLTLKPLAAGCCGMAGSYGHEAEHLDYSRQLFEMDWQQNLRDNRDHVLATGYSCRSQAARFGNITLKHPLQLLKELL